MSLQKNKIYRAEIVDCTGQGSAIAKIDGMVVFVPGGAVGDQCDIKIVKVNRRQAYGRIEKIIVESKHRITPACEKASVCGGCCYQHITYEEELRLKKKKVQDALTRIGHIDLQVSEIIGSEAIENYRNKAQYPVGRDKNGKAITGFYRSRSHEIIPTERCIIQSRQADEIAALVRAWMDENQVTAYDETTCKGQVRHLYIRTGFATGQALVCLVTTTSNLKAKEQLIEKLTAACPYIVGIVLNIQKKPGNQILGEKIVPLYGQDYLEDVLCGNLFRISPLSFYQVNRTQAEKLYQCAIDFAQLTGQEEVVDLYCGAGTITLALAAHAKRVTGVEVIPQAVENAQENAQLNGVENVRFFCADAGQAASRLALQGEKPDVIVIDPPRKGIDPLTIDAMVKMAPKRLVYVSCDPATMARDVQILTQNGYRAEACKAYDLFPRTFHVESVMLMTREGEKSI